MFFEKARNSKEINRFSKQKIDLIPNARFIMCTMQNGKKLNYFKIL